VGTVQHDSSAGTTLVLSIPQVGIRGMGGHEGLRLRGDRGEHALLVEADTVVATAILRVLKPRAPNLPDDWSQPRPCNSQESKIEHTFRLRQ
jgi:hypothetical protein